MIDSVCGSVRESRDGRLADRSCFFFQAEDGIRDLVRSRGLGDVYKRQARVSASIHPTEKDFHLHLVELQNSGSPEMLTLSLSLIHI